MWPLWYIRIPVITCLDRIARPEEVVLCLDNDEAGYKASPANGGAAHGKVFSHHPTGDFCA